MSAGEVCDWAANPVLATELRLQRIAQLNPRLHAFISLDAEGARHAAREAAQRRVQGRPLSPIDGMPIGIKANIAVVGWPFHAGIAAYRDRIATQDAACVAGLRAGGAVLLGLLNMDEAALGDTTDNPHFGRTENPLRPGYTAGGSSGGAGAAVAAGLCEAALGTDTLGSVRIPASYCGIVGHKPAPGGISTEGVVPLAPAFDSVGILAKSVATVQAVLACLGPKNVFPSVINAIGIFPPDGVDISPCTAKAFARTAENAKRLGYAIEPVPRLTHPLREIAKAALLIVALEATAQHASERARNPAGFSENFLKLLSWAEAQPEARRQSARALLATTAAEIRQSFASYAAFLMPTTPNPAFAFSAPRPKNTADFTTLANLAGLAATAIPVAPTADDLPSSVQIIAPNETTCLNLARQLGDRCAFLPPPPCGEGLGGGSKLGKSHQPGGLV
jgi:aspartyl-tRNA(Asn)/glutamyl-tRNA(Gln) amidotransferase subunit A